MAVSSSKLMLAGGKIVPLLENLVVSKEQLTLIWERLLGVVHPIDMLLLTVVGFLAVPLCGIFFGLNTTTNNKQQQQQQQQQTHPPSYSYAYLLVTQIAQLAQLAILVYLLDCWVVVLTTLGYNISTLNTLSTGFAKILYICWVGQRLSVLKRYFLSRAISRAPDALGRAAAVDRLVDGLIFSCTCFFLLDVLDVDMGIGITSIFAFGSAGTLVVGLASQNLATMFVNGLVLTTSDRIAEGDHIKFGNGNNGQIKKIGWFQTTLRHYDDLIEVIPNSELGMQRVTNLSRVKKCRVRQELRFRYEDAEKLDDLLAEILEEIKVSCPKVISDGSAVFRAVWTDFKEDHVKAVVEAHFELPPMGDRYWNNRQEYLKAIYRTCKKHKVEFVTGLYPNGLN
jgi:small-conductance mechanosensitive channel